MHVTIIRLDNKGSVTPIFDVRDSEFVVDSWILIRTGFQFAVYETPVMIGPSLDTSVGVLVSGVRLVNVQMHHLGPQSVLNIELSSF